MIAKIAVATFLGEERPKVVLEGGEGVMRAFGDHLGEDARLLVRVVVERVEKRVEGNHELCGAGTFFLLTAIESLFHHLVKGAHEPHPRKSLCALRLRHA